MYRYLNGTWNWLPKDNQCDILEFHIRSTINRGYFQERFLTNFHLLSIHLGKISVESCLVRQKNKVDEIRLSPPQDLAPPQHPRSSYLAGDHVPKTRGGRLCV